MAESKIKLQSAYSTSLNGSTSSSPMVQIPFESRAIVFGTNGIKGFVCMAYSDVAYMLVSSSEVTASISGKTLTLRNSGVSGYRLIVLRVGN